MKIDAICEQLEVLPFDKHATVHYAAIRCDLEKKGIPIGERDLQIAAIAIANGLCVVTHNTKEFDRVSGMELADWK